MKKQILFLSVNLFLIFSISVTSCSYSAQIDYQELLENAPGITISNSQSTLVISPENPKSALIFYPGGFVNYEAYLPLLIEFAKQNVKCFLVEMPADLAILYPNAASRYFQMNPEIENWYLGGHSLGGAMATTYISSNQEKCKGLVLLAAYSTNDISQSNLKVLSIYGSNDGVLNKENYNKYISNLPSNYEEHIIQGGNHGQFASYGFQKGDNQAEISSQEQWSQTATYVGNFCD